MISRHELHVRRILRVGLAISALALAPGCGGAGAEGAGAPISDPLRDQDAQHLFDMGVQVAQQGDFVRAEQYFTAARDHGYPEEQLMGPLMSVCIRSSRYSAALGYGEPYLERHPEDFRLRTLVATIQMSLDQPDAAQRNLRHVIEDAPDEAMPHYMLAVLLRDTVHDEPGMRAEMQRYLDLAPDGPHAEEARDVLGQSAPLPPGAPVRLDPAQVPSEPTATPVSTPTSTAPTTSASTTASHSGGHP